MTKKAFAFIQNFFTEAKIENDILERSRLRLMLFVVISFYLIWGLAGELLLPGVDRTFPIRLIAAVVVGTFVWFDYKKKFSMDFFSWAYFIFSNFTIGHMAYTSGFGNNHSIFVIGWLLSFFLVSFTYQSRYFMTIHLLSNLIYFFGFMLNSAESIVPVELLLIAILTCSALAVATLHQRQRYVEEIARLSKAITSNADEILVHKSQFFEFAKIAGLGEIARRIAFELNNPLAIIETHTLRLQKITKDSETAEKLGRISAATFRISSMIGSLQRVTGAANTDDKGGRIILNELVMDLVSLNTERFRKADIHIALSLPPEKIQVMGSSQDYTQVIIGLLNNAFDAVQEFDDKLVRLSIWIKGQKVYLTVEDSGQGFPANILENIFNPVVGANQAHSSFNLQLYLARQIVESYGGRLYYDATAPISRFVVEMPAVRAQASKNVA